VLLVLALATLLLFPAAAARAWRRGGSRVLWSVTAGTIAVGLAAALIAASEFGGNRLASTHGYRYTATRLVLLATLLWVLPLAASAASVRVAATRAPSAPVYPIAIAVCFAAAMAGLIVAIYSMI